MANNPNRRIAPDLLEADQKAMIALKSLKDYKPANASYSVEILDAKLNAMKSAQTIETNAQNTLSAARDSAVSNEWEFHNAILGAKQQVIAQYGQDSDEVQSLGLKKKSERKKPSKKKKL